jgi:MFS superfamily sulfate permease-like transporter
MKKTNPLKGGFSLATLRQDLPAGLVVFLVALPLCLGIALASGAPLFSGLIAGIVGGLITSVFSKSELAVSGPAAGLTVIVLTAIHDLGSYPAFLLAVALAGVIQIAMGFLKAGAIANYFPSNVIKGMLAAIGIILIIKQVPHAIGYDADYEGDFTFFQPDHENSFSALLVAFNKLNIGAVIISVVSLAMLTGWSRIRWQVIRAVPAPLAVVVAGIGLNLLFENLATGFALRDEHLVHIPSAGSVGEFISFFMLPDFSQFTNPLVYKVAGTVAIVASIETLLCIEAIDRLDPKRRHTPRSEELKAQGIGNLVSGLLGGLPLTAVIVRGSANINAGAQSKLSALVHGVFLLAAAIVMPGLINQIPYASLAAILLITGYKLTHLKLYRDMYASGRAQFIPFVITVIAIVFTDLLTGICIGLLVAGFAILRRILKNTYSITEKRHLPGEPVHIVLAQEVSFLNKAGVQHALSELPDGCRVILDGSRSLYIDHDVLELIHEFRESSQGRNIEVELKGIRESYQAAALAH